MFTYDVFISYRRENPDKAFTEELDRRLQACGFKVAIDRRDFEPNKHFVSEIDRCITNSRYTFLVISPRYFDSGNTEKEAVMSTVLSMADRTDRVVPVIIESVHLPNWLYGITGINFFEKDGSIDPYERVLDLLYSDGPSGVNEVERGNIKPIRKERASKMLFYGSFAAGTVGGIVLTSFLASGESAQAATEPLEISDESADSIADAIMRRLDDWFG